MTQVAGGAAAGGAAGSAAGTAAAGGSGTGASGAGTAAASGAANAAAGSVVANAVGAAGSAGTGTGSAAGSGAAAGAGGAAAAGAEGAAGAGQAAGAAGAAAGSAAAGAEGAAAGAGTLWTADWRESYAKDDPAKLNILKRYASPGAALDALFAAQQKIRSGETKQSLPENATPEQLAAFRQEHGIPDKPEGYFEKLPDGVKLDDADKVHLAPYAKLMHDQNLSPAAAAQFLAVRQQELDGLVEARVAADGALKTQTEDALRAEWGNDYRANINSIHGMLNGAPKEVSDAILNARTPDGNPLVGTLEVTRWLAQLSRELNPFGTIVPSTGGALDGKGVDARIVEIEGMMRKLGGEYYKGPKADSLQKEYRDLIGARERMKARTAA